MTIYRNLIEAEENIKDSKRMLAKLSLGMSRRAIGNAIANLRIADMLIKQQQEAKR